MAAKLYIKVVVSRDFWLFFMNPNPSGLLINSLKCFFLNIRFRGDIRDICDSAQANTAQSPNIFWVSIYRESVVHMLIFKKLFPICFENPKLTSTARSQ